MILSSCNDDKGKNIPSVSVEDTDARVIDFRPYARDTQKIEAAFETHPVMSEIFFHHILGLPQDDTSKMRQGFSDYIGLEATEEISQLIDSIYPDVQGIEEEWKMAMAFYHHYFPDHTSPHLYVLQSNLALANFLFENKDSRDAVGVSLGFFLGEAFPYVSLAHDNPVFSEYNSRTFNRDHLITKSVNAILDDLSGPPLEKNMLNSMIREGKRLYVLEAVCAEISDTAVFEMTPEQLQWCEDNEFEMWNFFIERELLYETDLNNYGKYLRPAPTSHGMPAESPGRTAAFTGYRIVDTFMENNPGLSFTDMLNMDNQTIYDRAKYKPKRK